MPATRGRRSSGRDGDVAEHSSPIVVRAGELVGAGLLRDEIQILLLTGLDDDLGQIRVDDFWVSNADRLKELGRGELVRLLALIGDMQAVDDALVEAKARWLESVLDGDDRDGLSLRP